MQYYIDGYNITKRDPATRDLSIEDQRAALEGRMRVRSVALLGRAAYTIVWDGAGGAGVAGNHKAKVQYTRLPTADDAIVAKVCNASVRVGVVTSDNELARRCKAVALAGVEILPAECLFEGAKASAKAKSRVPLRRDIGIPPNANEINRELKKLWGIDEEL
ncbi:MAG: NYN domain-containing protein [Raoultibacter sp.]